MKTPRKRGRKTNIERSLIKVVAIARAFGEIEKELQAGCTLTNAEISVIEKNLVALETAHWGLHELYETGRKDLVEIEPTLVDMVAFARKLCTRRDHLFTQLAAYRAELAIIEQSIHSLKAHHDYFRLRFEAKQEGRL